MSEPQAPLDGLDALAVQEQEIDSQIVSAGSTATVVS